MEEAEGSFGDLEGKLLNEDKLPKKIKTIIIILIIIILLLIAFIIFIAIYLTINQDKENDSSQDNKKSEEDYLLEINGFKEEWYDIYVQEE
jgi:flagellar basal body-associated protein FliL